VLVGWRIQVLGRRRGMGATDFGLSYLGAVLNFRS
jgi:hypothetical protein